MDKIEKLKEVKEFENYLSSKGKSELYSVYLNDTSFESKFEILADFIIDYFKSKPYHTFNNTAGFSASKNQDELEAFPHKMESLKFHAEGSDNQRKKLDSLLQKFHVKQSYLVKQDTKKAKQSDLGLIISNMESILQTYLNVSAANFAVENESADLILKQIQNNPTKITFDRNSIINKGNRELPRFQPKHKAKQIYYSSLPPLKAKSVLNQKSVSVSFEYEAFKSAKSGSKGKRTAGQSNYFIQSQELLYDPFINDKLYSQVGKYIDKLATISNNNNLNTIIDNNTDLNSYLELSLSDARNHNIMKSFSKPTFNKKKDKSQRTLIKGGASVPKFKLQQGCKSNSKKESSLIYILDMDECNTQLNTVPFSGDFQVFFSIKPNEFIKIRGSESKYIASILLDAVTLQDEIKRVESELTEVNMKLIKAKQFVDYMRSLFKADVEGVKFYESIRPKIPAIRRNLSAKSLEKHL